jgi:hypothetical protein
MKTIVAKYGWPGHTLVGEGGASAAWLVIQHADPTFQTQCLPLLKAAVERGEAKAREYAYLFDRVAMSAGRPQTYGTQFFQDDLGYWVPVPIADEANVDARRKAVGLPPLAENVAEMNRDVKPAAVVKDPAYRVDILKLSKVVELNPATAREQANALKALLLKRGWPTAPVVGQGAVDAAAGLAIRGELDLPFLRAFIDAQEAAFKRGETGGATLAYLVDQVLVREGKPQRYGTNFVWDGKEYVPSPIENEANVDARRATLGLDTLAEFAKMMKLMPPPESKS